MAISTAVPLTQVARGLGILTTFRDLREGNVLNLPPQIAVLGQGNTASTFSLTKLTLTNGAAEAAEVFGFGSPIHTAVLQLLPANGDGVGATPITVYPLADGTTAASGDVTPSGAPSKDSVVVAIIGGVRSQNILLPSGATVAAMTAAITAGINGTLNMPVIATDNTTDVGFAAKWQGLTGNDITIEFEGDTNGVTLAITAMSGGLGNPAVDTILGTMGDQWDNLVINCLNLTDTVALDAIQSHGDGRYQPLIHKPYAAFCGTVEADDGTVIAFGDGRKDDRINSAVRAPGGADQPWAYAARAVARIATQMRDNPPTDYAMNGYLTGLRVGPDADQPDIVQRDPLVKAGISTLEVVDGVYKMSDTVTFYHPDTEPIPGYAFVVDLVKLWNVIYNVRLEFRKPEWDGAPLLDDNTATNNPLAKQPKMARAVLSVILTNLALAAILTDTERMLTTIDADISSSNPKRLDMKFTAILSGNTNIISIDLDFGFNFGG